MTAVRDIDTTPQIGLVDTHCHLDDPSFADDLDAVLDRARSVGVTRWINVGYEPDRWKSGAELVRHHAGMHLMLGLHPGYADLWSPEVETLLHEHVAASTPLAIGEIGLDFFRGETNHDIQTEAFVAQLAIARTHGIPAVIHMRESEPILLDILRQQTDLPTLLFHSFDGSQELADWIVDHNAYLGVGGLSTRKKAVELRSIISKLPLDRIVLETDSPYLVPNGFKHRRNTPESIPFVARSLATLLRLEIDDISRRTTENAEHLFERLSRS